MHNISFIGVASGWGAQVRETEKGPDAFHNAEFLSSCSYPCVWKETLYPLKSAQEITLPSGLLTLPYIEDICGRLASSVEEVLNKGHFPAVIGGDHSMAVGTWASVARHYKAFEKFGLIWIDAHMDAHTMETTPSKAFHGMPLAALLGYGEAPLVELLEKSPVLNPQHICLIGVRSYEEGEDKLLKQLGVRIYFMKEVQERGFQVVLQEALEIVKKGTIGFGLSIDLDGFDPEDAPGVGTPESDGLRVQDVLPTLSQIQRDSSFKALEIVEYNPDRDKDGKTLCLMRNLFLHLLPLVGDKA
ncbi:MAG: arginase [Alphaproteobacteria bacterium]|nr:arginase [Alphaproteobacteria bacterium]